MHEVTLTDIMSVVDPWLMYPRLGMRASVIDFASVTRRWLERLGLEVKRGIRDPMREQEISCLKGNTTCYTWPGSRVVRSEGHPSQIRLRFYDLTSIHPRGILRSGHFDAWPMVRLTAETHGLPVHPGLHEGIRQVSPDFETAPCYPGPHVSPLLSSVTHWLDTSAAGLHA